VFRTEPSCMVRVHAQTHTTCINVKPYTCLQQSLIAATMLHAQTDTSDKYQNAAHTHTYTYIHTHAHTQTHTNTHIHSHTHTYTHTHTRKCTICRTPILSFSCSLFTAHSLPISLFLNFAIAPFLPLYLSMFLSLCIYLYPLISFTPSYSFSLFYCLSLSLFENLLPSLYLSTFLSFHLSISPSLSVSLSLHLSISPSLHLSVSLSLCLSVDNDDRFYYLQSILVPLTEGLCSSGHFMSFSLSIFPHIYPIIYRYNHSSLSPRLSIFQDSIYVCASSCERKYLYLCIYSCIYPFINELSRESSYISHMFSREPQKVHTQFHGSKRSSRH